MTTRPKTLRISPGGYAVLSAEAAKRGLNPDALAEQLVTDALGSETPDLGEALRVLAGIRRGFDSVDGIGTARAARDELEQRAC